MMNYHHWQIQREVSALSKQTSFLQHVDDFLGAETSNDILSLILEPVDQQDDSAWLSTIKEALGSTELFEEFKYAFDIRDDDRQITEPMSEVDTDSSDNQPRHSIRRKGHDDSSDAGSLSRPIRRRRVTFNQGVVETINLNNTGDAAAAVPTLDDDDMSPLDIKKERSWSPVRPPTPVGIHFSVMPLMAFKPLSPTTTAGSNNNKKGLDKSYRSNSDTTTTTPSATSDRIVTTATRATDNRVATSATTTTDKLSQVSPYHDQPYNYKPEIAPSPSPRLDARQSPMQSPTPSKPPTSVGLVDRPSEMQNLMATQRDLFAQIDMVLGTDGGDSVKAENWKSLLLASRERLDDDSWMRAIQHVLEDEPSLFAAFKDMVGYLGEAHSQSDDDDEYEFSTRRQFYNTKSAPGGSGLGVASEDFGLGLTQLAFEQPGGSFTLDDPAVAQSTHGRLERLTLSTDTALIVGARRDIQSLMALETNTPFFFNLMRSHLSSLAVYNDFMRLFRAPSDALTDAEWYHLIASKYANTPTLRRMFRDVLQVVQQGSHDLYLDKQFSPPSSSVESLLPLASRSTAHFVVERRGPQDLLCLEEQYPSQFHLLKDSLSISQYESMTLALQQPRGELPDDEWVDNILRLLSDTQQVDGMSCIGAIFSIAGVRVVMVSDLAEDDNIVSSPTATDITNTMVTSSVADATDTTPDTSTIVTSSTCQSVREELPMLVPTIKFLYDVKHALSDEKVFGKLLGRYIVEKHSRRGSLSGVSLSESPESPSKLVTQLLDEIVGPNSPVFKRFTSFVSYGGMQDYEALAPQA
ncbi:hypothetical protein SmJEL517_g00137 [Synchytrium microbalum]|uniref:Uncharacterized protein n=1 Tax=Synchytrium microbalum TaxID=1806994 RepID=A0A507CJC6_9FUNG|nr:uncharacterized protein SmJEL517_g00137 [Synchytrium microbalum]TPX38304.1 hypothetical protein SmJEL517_g00137 [Synchytrium microbalum]